MARILVPIPFSSPTVDKGDSGLVCWIRVAAEIELTIIISSNVKDIFPSNCRSDVSLHTPSKV